MSKPTLTPVPRGNGDGIFTSAEQKFYEDITADVLARTIWGEARGEEIGGMEAVACVIFNRVSFAKGRGGFWWGDDIIQVCQKPQQFSCWNRADPNFQKLQAVDERDLYFATAQRIARRAMAGALPDTTKGATHYHARHASPYWAKGETPSAVIGNHVFYKII